MKLQTLKPKLQTLSTGLQSISTAPQSKQWRAGLTSSQRGYDSKWQRARAAYLLKHPLCVMCEADDRLTAATVVDHIQAHRGDKVKFWDSNNWQSLCQHHHSSHAQRRDNQSGV